MAAAPQLHPFELPSSVGDALSSEDELWLLTRRNVQQPRSLFRLAAGGRPERVAPPPAHAIGVDICRNQQGTWMPVYVGAEGIVSGQGEVLLPGRFLFPLVDRSSLMALPSCDERGDTWLLFTHEGLRVRHPDGFVQGLELSPDVRGYSGHTQEGLRSQPAFGAAISIYLPRFSFQTTAGKQSMRLVVQKQNSVHLFTRGSSGRFTEKAQTIDFEKDLHVPRDMSPHPLWADLNADGSAELVMALTAGLSTETTRISRWSFASDKGLASEEVLMEREGFWLPLSAVKRPAGGEGVLLAEVNLGLTALASALLTGEIPLHTWFLPKAGAQPVRSHTFHPQIQLRGERRIGSRPIATLDLDGDSFTDLIDLSDPRNIVWYRGTPEGYESAKGGSLKVKPFTRHIVLNRANSLVLLAENESGGTTGTWIQGTAAKK